MGEVIHTLSTNTLKLCKKNNNARYAWAAAG